MSDQRGSDPAPPEARIDAKRMEPRLVVPDERQLRDGDDAIADAGDPQAASTVADPRVEDAWDIVVFPDATADVPHGTFVRRPRGAYRDREDGAFQPNAVAQRGPGAASPTTMNVPCCVTSSFSFDAKLTMVPAFESSTLVRV